MLDLKTNVWTEIKATGDLPSARSGHRMVVWKSFIGTLMSFSLLA